MFFIQYSGQFRNLFDLIFINSTMISKLLFCAANIPHCTKIVFYESEDGKKVLIASVPTTY